MKNKLVFISTIALISIALLYYFKSTLIITHFSKEDAQVELGRRLFFDRSLSLDGKVSCATCHNPNRAFTDGRKVSKGVFNRKTLRNAPSLLNVKNMPYFMFEGGIKTLEMQAIVPIKGHEEMGMNFPSYVKRIQRVKDYQALSIQGFGKEISPFVITKSLAQFERTLVSKNSKYDLFLNHKINLSKAELKGKDLFFKTFKCVSCHRGSDFTNYKFEFHDFDTSNHQDLGRFNLTLDSFDIGKFKIPSLRNLNKTAPYMHDGRFSNLNNLLDSYFHTRKTKISKANKSNLIQFLKTLDEIQN